LLRLRKKKKEEIYDYVINRFKRLKQVRDIYDLKVKDWVKQYNSIVDIESETLSNIIVPYIWIQANTIKPRITASIFNTEEYLEITSKIKEYSSHERIIRDYLLYKLNDTNFREKIRVCINLALIYPAAWTKVVLNKNNDPIISIVDFFNVWCSFTYENGRDDIFHRIETNMHNLKKYESEGIYENVDETEESLIDTEIPQLQAEIAGYFLGLDKHVIIEPQQYQQKGALQKAEILEWWGKYDINDDGFLEDIIVSIKNRKKGIRIDNNTYEGQAPLFPIRIIRNQKLIYGKVVAQVLESQQNELNTLRRQRIDFNNLILRAPLKARRTADIDWEDLFIAPDKIWKMDDPNDVVPIQFPNIPQTGYMEETYDKQDMQQAVGAVDPLMGMSPGGRQTATGMTILTSEGATRMKDYVIDVSEDIMKLTNFIIYVLKKFKKEKKEVISRLNIQKWDELTKDDLKEKYTIKTNITNVITNTDLRIQLLINLLNIGGKIPGVNVAEFFRQILNLAEVKSVDKILSPEEKEIEKDIVTQRNIEAEENRKKELKKTGIESPETKILGGGLEPIVPGLGTVIKNPILEAIKGMGGK